MDRFQYESLIADATARDEAARQINGIARTFARKIAPLYRALGIRWSDYFPRHEQIVEAIRDLSLEFNKTPGLTSISRRGIEISLDSGCWRLRFVYGMMGVIDKKKIKEGKDERKTSIGTGNGVDQPGPGEVHQPDQGGLSEGGGRPDNQHGHQD